MTILEIENLVVSYSNHIALEDINFKIEDGEYVCLVGVSRVYQRYAIPSASRCYFQCKRCISADLWDLYR